jgi:hypothetical protein
MAKDAGDFPDWEPQPGEKVGISVERTEELHHTVRVNGVATFLRHLGDHERYPYEVRFSIGGADEHDDRCYAREELYPVNDGRP